MQFEKKHKYNFSLTLLFLGGVAILALGGVARVDGVTMLALGFLLTLSSRLPSSSVSEKLPGVRIML